MSEEKKILDQNTYMMYKGKPLVREEDTICYGDLQNDSCVLILEIMKYRDEGGQKVPDKVLIQVVDSHNQSNILQQGVKGSLYEAFDLGETWLNLQLKKAEA
ncbi:MAG: hypothetical protein IJU20_05415 [Clostridia bacterium]|nr:hypothetical protein [Clostridia bacterium]